MTSSPNTAAGKADFSSSHPLSPELDPGLIRRGRGRQSSSSLENGRPSTNYFTLKAQAELGNSKTLPDVWTPIRIRERSKGEAPDKWRRGSQERVESPERPVTRATHGLDHTSRPRATVGSPRSQRNISELPPHTLDWTDPSMENGQFGPNQVLSTKWHELTDEQIQDTISRINEPKSYSEVSSQPYHSAIRLLSAALENTCRERDELEETHASLEESIEISQSRALQVLDKLPSAEREAGRRIFDIFTTKHRPAVTKRPSFMVSGNA